VNILVVDKGTSCQVVGLAARAMKPGSRELRYMLGHGYGKTANNN
jgi:hypothetical protein